jgi:Domain of unknown function (DUF4845)
MRSRQAGVTFIGWVVLLVPLAILFFAGLKLAPIYMTHFKVVAALEQTAQSNRGETMVSANAMRAELARRFDIEGIEEPQATDITIERDDGEWVLIAQYDRETSFLGNLALTVHFDKRVVVQ